jgi:hypothetical protein
VIEVHIGNSGVLNCNFVVGQSLYLAEMAFPVLVLVVPLDDQIQHFLLDVFVVAFWVDFETHRFGVIFDFVHKIENVDDERLDALFTVCTPFLKLEVLGQDCHEGVGQLHGLAVEGNVESDGGVLDLPGFEGAAGLGFSLLL